MSQCNTAKFKLSSRNSQLGFIWKTVEGRQQDEDFFPLKERPLQKGLQPHVYFIFGLWATAPALQLSSVWCLEQSFLDQLTMLHSIHHALHRTMLESYSVWMLVIAYSEENSTLIPAKEG